MARKLDPQATAAPAESDSAGAQLEAMSPNVRVTIAGRELEVREYGFFEGLDVAHRASRFIADMHATCRGGTLRYDRIRRLFGVHHDIVVAIAAEAAGVEPEWIRGLSRADADQFLAAWFSANAGFFVHEVVAEMREERRLAALSATGSPSLPGSAQPGSATSTASADTPSASSGASSTP